METLEKALKVVKQNKQEYESGTAYRGGRSKDWQATEDSYFGRVKKTLKGRFNIPIPIMSGFIDTLMSKIDDSPILRFRPTEEADFRATQKLQAFYDIVSKSEDNDYDSKDLDAKKLACFYGRAILKVYGESDPKFRFCMHVTDPYDFYVDPMGGGNLEDARYLGEDNIFLSKSDLKKGAEEGYYDKKAVFLLKNNLAENTVKENDSKQQEKNSRLASLGLVGTMHNFVGEGMLRFIESGTIVDGVRYKVLWNYETGLALRCVPLKEDFKSNLWWWVSWATHRDRFNFWSKAPADDIRPIAEIIKVLANQELDNRQKKNWGQRAYDPEVFPNGQDLEFRPNGLVATRSGASKVQPIASGIYEFQTPELTGTINLVNWLDNIAGQKSGVTAATQGSAEDAKVGIYQGNMQQVADRLGLYNKSYVKCHAAIGRRFVWACSEHLTKAQAVKLIGEKGVQWDTLKSNEINPDVDVTVESGASEFQLSELKKNKRTQALAQIGANPELIKEVNKKWYLEQILLNGEFTDEDVRVAQDTENDGNREVLAIASEKIQEIIDGKEPKLFRGATTGFQQKILDFATDNTDDDFDLFQRLIAYSNAHNDLVMENMSRKAAKMQAQMGMPPGIPGMPQMEQEKPDMGQEQAPGEQTGDMGQEMPGEMQPAMGQGMPQMTQ